jgi:hypothetical protein
MSSDFSNNPYGATPTPLGGPGGPPSAANAKSKVTGPAIGLIVSGVFWGLGALWALFNGIFAMFFMDTAMMQNQMNQQQLEQLESQGMDPGQILQLTGVAYVVAGVVGIIFAVVIILAGVKMMNLKSRGLAFTASILAMIPCSCGCIVGLPIGIWSLIVLSQPDVKSAFK